MVDKGPLRHGYIFDLDGTLADTMPAHYAAWQTVVRRYGLEFSERRFYELGGVPTIDITRMLIHESGRSLDPAVIASEKQAIFAKSLEIPGLVRAIEPVVEIARQMRHESPLAVASGGTRALVLRTLGMLAMVDWFQAIVTAEDTARHKPEPDVFLEAARRLGIPPTECTVYEDTDLGLEAARRAGMLAVDVRSLVSRPTAT